jgi:hypothetical protein
MPMISNSSIYSTITTTTKIDVYVKTGDKDTFPASKKSTLLVLKQHWTTKNLYIKALLSATKEHLIIGTFSTTTCRS